MNQMAGLMRRNLFRSICVILSVVLLIGIWVLRLDVHTLEVQNREHVQENQAMLSTLVSAPLVRQELARAQDIVQKIESNLIIESNLEDNIGYFYKLEKESNSQIISLRQQPSGGAIDDSEYKVIPYSLQLSGTYEQVAAFMLAIETGPKLAQVTQFSYHRLGTSTNLMSVAIDLKLLGRR